MNIGKDFENIVTKVIEVAQKWHKCPKTEVT